MKTNKWNQIRSPLMDEFQRIYSQVFYEYILMLRWMYETILSMMEETDQSVKKNVENERKQAG